MIAGNNYNNIGVFSFIGFARDKGFSTQNFDILEYSVNKLVTFILSPIFFRVINIPLKGLASLFRPETCHYL